MGHGAELGVACGGDSNVDGLAGFAGGGDFEAAFGVESVKLHVLPFAGHGGEHSD